MRVRPFIHPEHRPRHNLHLPLTHDLVTTRYVNPPHFGTFLVCFGASLGEGQLESLKVSLKSSTLGQK